MNEMPVVDELDGPEVTTPVEAASNRRDRGASIVEYALLVALIAVVCIGAITFLGNSTSDNYSRSTSSLFHS